MKKIALSLFTLLLILSAVNIANAQGNVKKQKIANTTKEAKSSSADNDIKAKLVQYASVPLKYDMGRLSERERELVGIFIQIADICDDIYWEQVFGKENRARLNELKDPALKDFAMIQYGAWDRLNGNKPFLPNYGEKPAGSFFYPSDMTKAEFDKIKDPKKNSPYTILRRNSNGEIDIIPYNKAYNKQLKQIDMLLEKAIELADDEGLRLYLEARREALLSNEYQKSDFVWMDMKQSRLDFVFGPIESYEDGLNGVKTAFEAFVLIKDEKWSDRLEHFKEQLPKMQKKLPCDPKYKKEKPGTQSDLNVYDVVYYAGECNAGGKTIAINLPNDEQVQLERGTRRLQLKNAMEAKFEQILLPIAKNLIDEKQLKHVNFEAFFNNVCFHEVAHGLGVKKTIDGKSTVREALKNQYSAWEEAKADICGLFMVQTLIESGEIKEITIEDAYVTYMAGLLRSVRFGVKEAHGIANIMCFNFLKDRNAFTREKNGRYMVDFKNMRKAVEEWAALVLKVEGDGDYKAASLFAEKNGVIRPELQRDLNIIEKANIPVDIVFEQGHKILGLEVPERKPDKTTLKSIDTKIPTIQPLQPRNRTKK